MAFARLPINSLSGGVGRQVPSKRLTTEAENIDNCLVTLEKSVEKRPPLVQVKADGGLSYLDVVRLNPVTTGTNGNPINPPFNPDNLYFHFLDIDGDNRYCIIINRAGVPFDPVNANQFEVTVGQTTTTINLTDLITVYRIEPTEWIKETVDNTAGWVNNTSGFNRGIYEYITFGNRTATGHPYKIANSTYQIDTSSTKQTFGSIDYNIGIILWNKLIPLDFLPNNADLEVISGSTWVSNLDNNNYIHAGDKVSYKVADQPDPPEPVGEDVTTTGWLNVRDDVEYIIDSSTLEEEEVGQNVNSFDIIPQYPASEVQNDINDANGWKATRMLHDLYDNPRLITYSNPINWSTDQYQITSPLSPEDRDNANDGFGKIYYTRNPYLSFPIGFYRAMRYTTKPYFMQTRTEEKNSVFDHRRFPILIYKDFSDNKWKVSHMPLSPRLSGTESNNPGLKGVRNKEKIQSMAIWKNRLWIGTDNSVIASETGNFFNFWINDINNITETDPIDIESTVGSYNRISHMLPFQNLMFVTSSGSVQFEIRGGSNEVAISPFNVEFRPTSFFSTSKLVSPQKLGNNIFYMDSSKVYLYLSGSTFSDEYSASTEINPHCKNYLPQNIGAIAVSNGTNTMLMVDEDNKDEIYLFTFRMNGDKVAQNASYRWVLDNLDSVVAMKAYEKDLYIISKRPSGIAGKDVLVVYFTSMETVPVSTPMLDWLTKVETTNITYNNQAQTTTITLPHYDPSVDYVILAPGNEWGTAAYTSIKIPSSNNISSIVDAGVKKTLVTITGNYSTGPVYVGRSYLMNIELSQLVYRSPEEQVSYEGVLNLKRITTRHLLSGSYDILVTRRGRDPSKVSFFPTDINSILDRNDELKIDTVGEQFSKILSYSEACKIQIQSEYPTPCNISNIEVIGNFRLRNTSIE